MTVAAEPQKPKGTIAYGIQFPVVLPEPQLEVFCFGKAPTFLKESATYTGEGRKWHAERAIHLLWGKHFEMHEWAEQCLDLFCNYNDCSVTGPKSAGKTTTAAIYALLFWLRDPHNTAVLVCTTTLDGLRKRIWKEIKHFFRFIQHMVPGVNPVDSKTAIQSTKNDDAHGLFGIAVAGGSTQKAMGRIIGFHPKNLLIVVDEATDTPEAIDEACANLNKVSGEFQIIRLGNASSRFDPHGKACEPKDGWKSINVEDEFWETHNGACLHLDGTKSPNFKFSKTKFKYLLNQRDIDVAADPRNGGEDSVKFWRFIRGFWAPDGTENTVLTESMAVKFDVRLPIGTSATGEPDTATQWVRKPTPCASLDPAFGGDRCVLKFGQYGLCRDGRTRMEFTATIPIHADAVSKEPLDYQIATKVMEECKARGVQPQHFGTDSTGTGRGVAAILRTKWSPRIHSVEFVGAASERIMDSGENKKCSEQYKYFVTELWYAFRLFVVNDQIRGLGDEDIREFCTRQYRVLAGGFIQVETKMEMKKRTNGVSPDNADCAVVMTEVLRRNGVSPNTETLDKSPERAQEWGEWSRQAAALDFDANPYCYTDANP